MAVQYRGRCVHCRRTDRPLDAAEGIGICPRCAPATDAPEDEPGISGAAKERRLIARAAARLTDLGDVNLALKLCDHFELKCADADPRPPRVDPRQGR